MNVQQLVEHLQSTYKPEDIVASHIWSIADVKFQAEEMEVVGLTKEDMANILVSFDHHLSAENGLTWIGLENEIRDYLGVKEIE